MNVIINALLKKNVRVSTENLIQKNCGMNLNRKKNVNDKESKNKAN